MFRQTEISTIVRALMPVINESRGGVDVQVVNKPGSIRQLHVAR